MTAEQQEVTSVTKAKKQRLVSDKIGQKPPHRWSKNLTLSMITDPYLLGKEDGIAEGMMSDDYVSERIAKIFFDQLECETEDSARELVSKSWAWRKAETRRRQLAELERLRMQTQENVAAIEAIEKEVFPAVL